MSVADVQLTPLGRAAVAAERRWRELSRQRRDEVLRRVAAGEPQAAVARSLGLTPQAVAHMLRRARARRGAEDHVSD